MRKTGTRVGSVFYSSTLGKKRHLSEHLQQVSYILPLTAGASCSVTDAQRLFSHYFRMSCTESESGGCADYDSKVVFDDCLSTLQRLGLFSIVPHEHAESVESGVVMIHRTPIINVELYSIEVVSSRAAYLEERGRAALFQLLHGVIVPLLHSSFDATTSKPISNCTPKTSGVGAANLSNSGLGLAGSISADSCILQLQQLKGSCLGGVNNVVRRFTIDIVNEAILLGVRDRLLHTCGADLFCLHHDVVHQTSPSLLALQWWWWRQVEPLVRKAIRQRVDSEYSSLNVWVETAKAQALHLIRKRDKGVPRCLMCLSTDAAMAFFSDALRCWLITSASLKETLRTAPPGWNIHLLDEARKAVALGTIQSAKLCLARRPAGIPVTELADLLSWPVVSKVLGKKSLLKALECFPSHFRVSHVQGLHVVQRQLLNTVQGDVTQDEVTAWVQSGQNVTQVDRATFRQDVNLVVRAVTFVRKHHLRHRPPTFGELHKALISSTDTQNGNFLLDVLYRYDAIAADPRVEGASWESVKDKRLQLSTREVCALNAFENFRKKLCNKRQLYIEAIEPFLLLCRKEIVAYIGSDDDAGMPLSLLERWLQLERLQLVQADLIHILRENAFHFSLNEVTGCIYFERGEMDSPAEVSVLRLQRPTLALNLPPPPPPPTAQYPEFTFESKLLRVQSTRQLDALFRFAQSTVHGVFTLLLPQVSSPSGVRLQTLLRRVRWAPVAATLGPLSFFVDAFDGFFFDVFDSDAEGTWVAAHRGPVGDWLLYARLIARLFPSDIDIPLRLVAEGLSWNLWFAPRFGDLASLLRRVGRCCVHGHLLKKTEAVPTVSGAAFPAVMTVACDDTFFWKTLMEVRRHYVDHHQQKQQRNEYINLELKELFYYMCDALGMRNDEERLMQLARTAVRRLPLFFRADTALIEPGTILQVTLPHATASSGVVALVEEYICPLLRQHCDISVAELDSYLGWSCGGFDSHPAGVGAIHVPASAVSLCGVLQRYVEGAQTPLLILDQGTELAPLGDGIMVRPNTAVYRSPEDMLLEVNGLEYALGEGRMLRPTGKPVSLFEVLAEERELHAGEGSAVLARTEKWHVLLECKGRGPLEWEKELSSGRGDITVWCQT